VAIVATLAIQSTTKPWLARRLDLAESDEQAAGPTSGPEGAPHEDWVTVLIRRLAPRRAAASRPTLDQPL